MSVEEQVKFVGLAGQPAKEVFGNHEKVRRLREELVNTTEPALQKLEDAKRASREEATRHFLPWGSAQHNVLYPTRGHLLRQVAVVFSWVWVAVAGRFPVQWCQRS